MLSELREQNGYWSSIPYGYLMTAIMHNDDDDDDSDDDDEDDKVEGDNDDVGQPSSSANIWSARIRMHTYICMS